MSSSALISGRFREFGIGISGFFEFLRERGVGKYLKITWMGDIFKKIGLKIHPPPVLVISGIRTSSRLTMERRKVN